MIVQNPITLPYSKFISNSVTTLIFEIRKNQTLEISALQYTLVDATRVGKVDAGKGIVFDFQVDFQSVNDYSTTSSLLQTELPNMVQETIMIDKYKFVRLSTSYELAMDSTYNVNETLSWLKSLLQKTVDNFMYEETVALIKNSDIYKTPRTTQLKEVEWTDVSALTDNREKVAGRLNNAQEVANLLKKLKIEMQIPNNDYTDVVQYEDINTGTNKPIKSAVSEDQLILFLNSDVAIDIETGGTTVAFNPETLSLGGTQIVYLPAKSFADPSLIGILCYRGKFALADFYNVGRVFVDGSNLFETLYLHFAYGQGVFKTAPAAIIRKA